MRLNAFLARAGVASRRGADELIKSGQVKVNGKQGQLNSKVNSEDKVTVNGKSVGVQKLRYILLNKPAHTVTTLKDTDGRPTVIELLDIEERVVPVGRLDTNTTGALLLTNDGPLAHKLMHPSFEIDKVYEAEVEGEITKEKLAALENGIELEDGRAAPAQANQTSANKIELTVHEGRNHQVKRMMGAVDLKVKKLHRSKYGPLNLQGLELGRWRELTETEVKLLKH